MTEKSIDVGILLEYCKHELEKTEQKLKECSQKFQMNEYVREPGIKELLCILDKESEGMCEDPNQIRIELAKAADLEKKIRELTSMLNG